MAAVNTGQLIARITCSAHHASGKVERYTRQQKHSTGARWKRKEKKDSLNPVSYTIEAKTSSKTFKTANSSRTLQQGITQRNFSQTPAFTLAE